MLKTNKKEICNEIRKSNEDDISTLVAREANKTYFLKAVVYSFVDVMCEDEIAILLFNVYFALCVHFLFLF